VFNAYVWLLANVDRINAAIDRRLRESGWVA